jgi:hypothetical protein
MKARRTHRAPLSERALAILREMAKVKDGHVTGLSGAAKFEIHTLSLSSTVTAHGPGRPPPVKGEPGYWLPSGRSNVTLPPSGRPFCFFIARAIVAASDASSRLTVPHTETVTRLDRCRYADLANREGFVRC